MRGCCNLARLTLLGVGALGIVEAEASFVPEVKRVRERPLPQRVTRAVPTGLHVVPEIAFGSHDVTLGVGGVF